MDEIEDRATREYVTIVWKIKDLIADAQHHKDNNHFQLHTDWMIAKLKELIE